MSQPCTSPPEFAEVRDARCGTRPSSRSTRRRRPIGRGELLVEPRHRHHDLRVDLRRDGARRSGGSAGSRRTRSSRCPPGGSRRAGAARRPSRCSTPGRGTLVIEFNFHSDGRLGAVQRDDPEVVVARAGVVERDSRRRREVARSLREVARHQVGPQRLARQAVQEVVVPVVGALADLDHAVGVLDHVRLARPPRSAPDLIRASNGCRRRRSACTARRSLDSATGSRGASGSGPRRSSRGSRCPGTSSGRGTSC